MSSGYGYNDQGRDTLEEVYASVFHTEAALVRPQITCGTHALGPRTCMRIFVLETAAIISGWKTI